MTCAKPSFSNKAFHKANIKPIQLRVQDLQKLDFNTLNCFLYTKDHAF